MVFSINLFVQKRVSLYFPRPVARKYSTQPPDPNLNITVTFPSCSVTFPDCAVKFLQYFSEQFNVDTLKALLVCEKASACMQLRMNNPITMKKRQRNIIYVTNISNERTACTIQILSGQGRQMSLAHENSTMDVHHSNRFEQFQSIPKPY